MSRFSSGHDRASGRRDHRRFERDCVANGPTELTLTPFQLRSHAQAHLQNFAFSRKPNTFTGPRAAL